ncbi:MAG: Cro/Cl family transcriptional regulator [Deltaproteobacteria bacterium HGW-Deltaproteobacteria-8]|jgi:phage repressor protein C with HTH and peptisase S24 domain|nr:MAG: Cro/Cl family transcriptional regulator [Deltaproteobacteria bacterium HGW-Deltaproteobacteria-8]
MSEIGYRLKAIRKDESQEAFAARFGVHRNTLARWESGDRTPDLDFVQRLVSELGIAPEWVLRGVGPMHASACVQLSAAAKQTVCDVDLMFVPMVEARISAGTGSFQTEVGSERLYAFRSDFLSRKGSPAQMVLMHVSGDSMEPEIKHGDTVLIDQSQCEPRPGTMYAVRVGELIYLKVVDALPEGLVLKSINAAYEPMKVDLRGDLVDGVAILGKVIWWCREAK